jgi:hypothetical protein
MLQETLSKIDVIRAAVYEGVIEVRWGGRVEPEDGRVDSEIFFERQKRPFDAGVKATLTAVA